MSLPDGALVPDYYRILGKLLQLGYELMDISQTARGEPISWDELNKASPAKQLRVGKLYFIVPIPSGSQTRRDAYAVTCGMGPSLRIDEPGDPKWKSLRVGSGGPHAVFSRFGFTKDEAIAFSVSPGLESDVVMMSVHTASATIEEHFEIISAESYRAEREFAGRRN